MRARWKNASVIGLACACVLALAGCKTFQPEAHFRFEPEEEGPLWAVIDKADTRIKKPGPGSPFTSTYLQVSAHDHSNDNSVSRGVRLTDHEDAIKKLVKPAKGGDYHGLDGAIVFLAQAKLIDPDAPSAFRPIDWKLGPNRDDTRLRFVLQSQEKGKLAMTVTTHGKRAIESWPAGKKALTSRIVGRSCVPVELEETVNTIAITFRQEDSGWTTMKVFVVPDGGNVHPFRKPVIEKKFRIAASAIDWNTDFTSPVDFGIVQPRSWKTDYVELDELRIFGRHRLFIQGIPWPRMR